MKAARAEAEDLCSAESTKMAEYFVYFPFLQLNGCGKRFALQPQTIYSEFPLLYYPIQ
ncbi:MAG: hypothetical protein ACI3W5_11235 [Faecousia sp.]